MRILGISAFYHDSAGALVDDRGIVAAAQAERFTRKKHDSNFPRAAIAYCLEEAGVALNCVGNGKVPRDGAFENIWIQPSRQGTPARSSCGPRSISYDGRFSSRPSRAMCITETD